MLLEPMHVEMELSVVGVSAKAPFGSEKTVADAAGLDEGGAEGSFLDNFGRVPRGLGDGGAVAVDAAIISARASARLCS